MNKSTSRQGFTLVEIAIVLVIIGLLLGGILKGQELINNAKVRAIADRQNSLKVAWFSFIDRYQALPGDYIDASTYIKGAGKGNGDGRIAVEESVLSLQHMSVAGYLRCAQCTATGTALPSAANSLVNTYGGVMSIWNDGSYFTIRADAASPRLMVHTGPRIPSNVIAEVDRKIDDGLPNGGDFVFNSYDPTELTANSIVGKATDNCMKQDTGGKVAGELLKDVVQYWRPANSSPPVFQDCGASVFI